MLYTSDSLSHHAPPEQTPHAWITLSRYEHIPALAGPLNPVIIELLASVQGLHSSTVVRNTRDKEYIKVMAENTASIMKLAREKVSSWRS